MRGRARQVLSFGDAGKMLVRPKMSGLVLAKIPPWASEGGMHECASICLGEVGDIKLVLTRLGEG